LEEANEKRCPRCKTIRSRRYFYNMPNNGQSKLSSYCVICTRNLQRKIREKKYNIKIKKKNNSLKEHTGSNVTRLMKKTYPLPEPVEYILCAQKLLTDLKITLRQMRFDKLNPKMVNSGMEWSEFIIEYKLLKEIMEDF
jgi:hypothetical protein